MLRYLFCLFAFCFLMTPAWAEPASGVTPEVSVQARIEQARAEQRESHLVLAALLLALWGLGLSVWLAWALRRASARTEHGLGERLAGLEHTVRSLETALQAAQRAPQPMASPACVELMEKLLALAIEGEAKRDWPMAASCWGVLAECQSDNAETWYKFAHALDVEASIRQTATSGEWQKIALAYGKALEIRPGEPEWLTRRGAALLKWGDTLSGDERPAKLEAACALFAEALRIRPDYVEAFSNWAGALRNLAQCLEGEARQTKLAEACQLCARAAQLKPDHADIHHNWAAALIDWSWELSGDERQAKLDEAARHCLAAERLQPGSGAYNLACVSALSGQPEDAQRWLEVCAERQSLPSPEHLLADRDLASLHGLPWFEALSGR